MTDLTAPIAAPLPALIIGARSTSSQRRRWRFANTAITTSFGAVVVATSIYLGVTAPSTSPVVPAATTTVVGPATGTTPATQVDQQPFGQRGDGPRDHAGGFGDHRGPNR